MDGPVEGHWSQMTGLSIVKAGQISLAINNEYIVHIGGSQDTRYTEIEVWRYIDKTNFHRVSAGESSQLKQWQYYPNAFNFKPEE